MIFWYATLGYGIFNNLMINEAEMMLLKHNGITVIVR